MTVCEKKYECALLKSHKMFTHIKLIEKNHVYAGLAGRVQVLACMGSSVD